MGPRAEKPDVGGPLAVDGRDVILFFTKVLKLFVMSQSKIPK